MTAPLTAAPGHDVVYELPTSAYPRMTPDQRTALGTWLAAHDIDVGRVAMRPDLPILVRVGELGALTLEMWLHVYGDDGFLQPCPHCPPGCQVTERARTTLVAVPPEGLPEAVTHRPLVAGPPPAP